jgi:hypothetical protein
MFRPRGLHFSSLIQLLGQKAAPLEDRPRHVFFCIGDHYEPMHGAAPPSVQEERVERWVREYPKSFDIFQDSRGRRPQHTFFYPAEDYNPALVERVAELCRRGYGEMEVHLHHDNDSSENLRETLETFKSHLFYEHGMLSQNHEGQITYGFIHGNWALDNSRPDGRWCGVNDELTVLRETGCYADFTMPSAPSPTQTRTINSIYYAIDDPCKPKSHDTGIEARVGQLPPRGGLLMIQGPLSFDWSRRKFGLLPRLDNADLHGGFPPTARRLDNWLHAGVSVAGRPDWVFVKLHTHGAKERNAAMLLGEPMRQFHQTLANRAARDERFRYYYVTAREMADLVDQAESGIEQPFIETAVR